MYYLILVALVNWQSIPPRVLAPFTSGEECAKAAGKANADPAFQTDEGRAMGLRFLCAKVVMDT